jgi:phosphate transport system protein
MSTHLQKEVAHLKIRVLALSAIVEQSVWRAVKAIETRSIELSNEVIDGDDSIDQVEVEVEEECLKILALYQPVAIDLRFIVAVLKMNDELERIGDLAVNIAERALYLSSVPAVSIPFDFPTMADKARGMLKQALDAMVNMDPRLARHVCAMDDEVDAINREMYENFKRGVRQRPEDLDALLHLLSVSRHLERIADLATNIAEDVIYMVEGEIVRHRIENYTTPLPPDEGGY